MSFRRLAGIAGIAFVVLIVLNITLSGESPEIKDPVSDVVEYYQDEADSLRVAAILNQISGVFIAVFGAGVLTAIWRAERNTGRAWGIVGLIGLITTYSAVDGSAVLHSTLLLNEESLGADGLTRALFDANVVAFAISSFNIGVFLLGVGAGILTTRVLPTWLGWGALVGAAFGVISAFGHGDRDGLDGLGVLGFLTAGLFFLFTLLAGIIMATREESEPVATTA